MRGIVVPAASICADLPVFYEARKSAGDMLP